VDHKRFGFDINYCVSTLQMPILPSVVVRRVSSNAVLHATVTGGGRNFGFPMQSNVVQIRKPNEYMNMADMANNRRRLLRTVSTDCYSNVQKLAAIPYFRYKRNDDHQRTISYYRMQQGAALNIRIVGAVPQTDWDTKLRECYNQDVVHCRSIHTTTTFKRRINDGNESSFGQCTTTATTKIAATVAERSINHSTDSFRKEDAVGSVQTPPTQQQPQPQSTVALEVANNSKKDADLERQLSSSNTDTQTRMNMSNKDQPTFATVVRHWGQQLQAIPNIITVSRILLIPFLCYWIVVTQQIPLAVMGCVYAAVSDVLDGCIARTFPSMQTPLGTYLDPLGKSF
jgi:CDP-alcohol phosphatidyltransferase